jgi:hypothetical protein
MICSVDELILANRSAIGNRSVSCAVVQTLRNQTQSNPISARLSSSASGISSKVAVWPSLLDIDCSVSQTRVFIC